ncbi:MAG: HAD-IB family hydrolase, partial [Sphingomonadales bacterium]|nr:HAD-IB family hydrolase [Sphingomonadales bacterium]
LGFDDVVATASRRDEEGRVLARIDGENCYGTAKLRMIEAWAADYAPIRGAIHVRFHSDSESDLPVFEWSDERIAVNPTAKLRKLAEERGWPIIAWG